MNHRLTVAAAVAVILASISEWVLIRGGGWLAASIGAVIVVALAGTLTRLAPTQAAIGATVLAAVASAPLLFDSSLLLKAAGLIIIGCCAASATRVRVLRPVADLVTYLAALLLYLNLTLSNAKSFALLIPTARSLHHLVTLVNRGGLAAKNTPPVQGSAGVILLAAASIGLAAIVVDVIAVRLRKPAIAGLPLLVIYMAPIATAAKSGGPSSIITFLLAAIGYLGSACLGRQTPATRLGPHRHSLALRGARTNGSAGQTSAAWPRPDGGSASPRVCAAIVAPLLLPSLNLHRLFGDHGGGPKIVPAGLPNPVDQMHALLTESTTAPVLSYTSTSASGEYLQVYVLNYVAGKGEWKIVTPNRTLTIGQKALLAPPGVASNTAGHAGVHHDQA